MAQTTLKVILSVLLAGGRLILSIHVSSTAEFEYKSLPTRIGVQKDNSHDIIPA